MAVIKYQHLFDLNWQAAGSSQAVLLTKVFAGGPHPSHSSIFLSPSSCFYLYISFSLSSPTAQHIAIINNDTHRKGKERRLKNSRKTRDTQSCVRVVVMTPPPPSPLRCNIVHDCNRTSGENKVTILLPKYRDLTLGE